MLLVHMAGSRFSNVTIISVLFSHICVLSLSFQPLSFSLHPLCSASSWSPGFLLRLSLHRERYVTVASGLCDGSTELSQKERDSIPCSIHVLRKNPLAFVTNWVFMRLTLRWSLIYKILVGFNVCVREKETGLSRRRNWAFLPA